MGSPPRMRGKPIRDDKGEDRIGITPAHAGKTFCAFWSRRPERDHPRACGENAISAAINGTTLGSPPRMRGKPSIKAIDPMISGITPAHAGKTYHARCTISGSRDHPRACGENTQKGRRFLYELGSPPRMRGKPEPERNADGSTGITPAHAGKTGW